MFELNDKHAVVTGGGSGIGLATATRFRAAGATVAIVDRDNATDQAARIGATAFRADVSDETQLAAAIDAAASMAGRIDVLVNNAGIAVEAPIESVTNDQMLRSFGVNALGVLNGMRAAAAHMPAGGAIVNTASLAGLVGFPEYAAYCAAKSAVVALTRVAALEYGPRGVRVNCICPGSVDTPMLAAQPSGELEALLVATAAPLGRIVRPDEVAALIHFLAADDCPMLSGLAVPIDGGITAGTSVGVVEAVAAQAGEQKAVR